VIEGCFEIINFDVLLLENKKDIPEEHPLFEHDLSERI
jgi:hypothetical protein